MESDPSKEIRKILLLSDIHLSINIIAEIKVFYRNMLNNEPKFDLILISGDFGKLTKEDLVNNNEKVIARTEEQIEEILKNIKEIFELEKNKIFFIPGNHDPPSLFEGKETSEFSVNIHNNYTELFPGLSLIGLGGSVPSFVRQKDGTYKPNNWFPYPYSTDEAYGEDLKNLFENFEKEFPKNQILLMTHTGPHSSGTTVKLLKSREITGSKCQNNIVKKYSNRILCNVHGHCHKSRGQCLYAGVPIINPGSLKENKFGEIVIYKNSLGWKLISSNFYDLE